MYIQGLKDIKIWMRDEHHKNINAWKERNGFSYGINIVGDHDEDYVLDALFNIPNR